MILTYCCECHQTLTLELPIKKENTNPKNGDTICYGCYNKKFSDQIIRDEKLNKLLNPSLLDRLKIWIYKQ